MTAYYNEIDPYAAQWLRNLISAGLIAPGIVDERSIEDVRPDDLRGFTQCHFFAGIGVWSFALRLAGWPDDRPVWTGSCPCQPFSIAAVAHERAGLDDPRHLFPVWFNLIKECAPGVVFGEQVGSRDGLEWLDEVFDKLENANYACGAHIISAAGAGADHIRKRLYFVADAMRAGRSGYLALERFSVTTPETFAESRDAAIRIRLALAGDYADLLPRDESTVAVERSRAKGYGNAINAQTASAFIRAADEAMTGAV
jgi:DNA (cytosine-5)-methyltransferase 1